MSNRLPKGTSDIVRPRAWIAIALDSSAYDDHTGTSYQYDSKVQNHKQVHNGDLLFIRSRTGLQGVGRIKRIERGFAQKDIARCPQCKKSLPTKVLLSRLGPFRCSNGHVFPSALIDKIDVTTFVARFDGDWLETDKAISAIELRRFALSKSAQLSIMAASRDELVNYIGAWSPQFRDRLRAWAGLFEKLKDEDADEEPDLTPKGQDHRWAALRSIRLRRGQRNFRDALLHRFLGKCAISGCSILGVLEAAHLRPYRGPGDNHPTNGLLLRSDLHTLFDLDLLGIDPSTYQIALAPILRGSDYEQFEGVVLALAPETSPNKDALQLRWSIFCAAHSKP